MNVATEGSPRSHVTANANAPVHAPANVNANAPAPVNVNVPAPVPVPFPASARTFDRATMHVESEMAEERIQPGAPGNAPQPACGCGGAEEGVMVRKAVGVDEGIRDRNIKRLRRIEGQVRGLQRMVEEGRYCADIMTQIASVQEALRSVGRELMRNHLKHCAAAAIRTGDEAQAEAMYDELIDLMYRHVR